MSGLVQVVVYPPSPSGGRRVRADGEILGLARSARDVAELGRRAGMTGVTGVTEANVGEAGAVEWRGGGAEVARARGSPGGRRGPFPSAVR
ncbi:hypothetical protein WP39_09640 [Streptomyces sp. 604F]|uniref:hypothetical protein n=1 Tax=Streptomyces sp. 604F TaxID=1476754 RepID=UPI001B32CCC7|nr:hypothetical protein [Streptomyces sp. 604F]MBP3077715.1 hypothetical protein [Streptomyces sp. 604F]